ncbi:hypothetical protein B0H13DRAFT_1857085 [Mycena leptocephala]|nr:hypothetical protein B0H13DRAFT_1857085 [Mycena leptocephala]
MPEEAERAVILPASTAYSSRPDRARIVGGYVMATPQWSGWERDELAHAIPGETIIWAMSHDDSPSRQDSSGFRDNDAGRRAPNASFATCSVRPHSNSKACYWRCNTDSATLHYESLDQ